MRNISLQKVSVWATLGFVWLLLILMCSSASAQLNENWKNVGNGLQQRLTVEGDTLSRWIKQPGFGDPLYVYPTGKIDELRYSDSLYYKGELANKPATVSTIAELQSYAGDVNAVVVTDSLRGGIFNYVISGVVPDGGTIFHATGKISGFWVRNFNKSEGLNVLWYGADPYGISDNYRIFSDVIFKYSSKTNKVVIPNGVYNVSTMIGRIDMSPDTSVTWNLDIIGIGKPVLKCVATSTIQSVLGFTVRDGKNLRIDGITIDADKKSARGIYLKFPSNTGGVSDNCIVDNNTVMNCYTLNLTVFSPAGIHVSGNINNLLVRNNFIKNIGIGPDVLNQGVSGITGILTGTTFGFDVKYTTITNNYIDGIAGDDNDYAPDQVGIYTSSNSTSDTLNYRAVIANNTIKNCRSRFVKSQVRNTYVLENTMVIDTVTVVDVTSSTVGIDLQYGDGEVRNNVMSYFGSAHRRGIAYTDRTTSKTQNIISGNKIQLNNITGAPMYSAIFANSYHPTIETRIANTVVSDNMVVGQIAYFLESRFKGNEGTNIMKVMNNRVDNITSSFFYLWGSTGSAIKLAAENNLNFGTIIPFVTNTVAVTYVVDGVSNQGFSGTGFSAGQMLKIDGTATRLVPAIANTDYLTPGGIAGLYVSKTGDSMSGTLDVTRTSNNSASGGQALKITYSSTFGGAISAPFIPVILDMAVKTITSDQIATRLSAGINSNTDRTSGWFSVSTPTSGVLTEKFRILNTGVVNLSVQPTTNNSTNSILGIATGGNIEKLTTIPVSLGGTGRSSITLGSLQKGNGTGALVDAVANADYLPVNNPALTGIPTAPTAAPGTNTAQIATTAFVQAAIPAMTSGTYTPVVTDVTNITSSTPQQFFYTRIGNIVQVTGSVTIVSPGGSVSFKLTLPIATTMTSYLDLIGMVQSPSSGTSTGQVAGDVSLTNLVDVMTTISGTGLARITFTYIVK